MVFSSVIFLFYFLPIVLLGYYVLQNITLRNVFLLIASLIFYASGEGILVVLVVVSSFINYFFGYLVAAKPDNKKLFVTIGIILNLALLIYYKYIGFIIDNINHMGIGHVQRISIALPIGISFFTFHGLSYLIDVYRDSKLVQKSYFKILLYITFFPQLIAGPIIRYHDVASQLSDRQLTFDKTIEGIRRFVLGLAKKVLLANPMGVVADKIMGSDAHQFSTGVAWLGTIAYSMQIFFDFSGYSDMAIGLAKIFGFEFLENFNFPYISRSIREFWTRWHISLTNWFKDYLYIPLGGNRKGELATYRNLLIVFFCTGFWHGASWTFLLWGFFHGFFICIERLFLGKQLAKSQLLSRVYFFVVLMISWVFFRIENLGQDMVYLGKMFIFTTKAQLPVTKFMTNENWVILSVALFFCIPWHKIIVIKRPLFKVVNNYVTMVYLIVLFLLSIMSLVTDTYNPFIYYRF